MSDAILDLSLYRPQVSDDEGIRDHNEVLWHIYAGVPVAQFVRLKSIQQRWPTAQQIEEAGGIDDALVTEALDALWANLKRANPGKTREEFEDGFDADEILLGLNFLYLRMKLRMQQAGAQAQPEQQAAQSASAAAVASTRATRKPKPARSSHRAS